MGNNLPLFLLIYCKDLLVGGVRCFEFFWGVFLFDKNVLEKPQ